MSTKKTILCLKIHFEYHSGAGYFRLRKQAKKNQRFSESNLRVFKIVSVPSQAVLDLVCLIQPATSHARARSNDGILDSV